MYTASLSVVSEREVQDVWRGRYAILPNVRGREETSGKSEKLRIFQCDLLQAKLNPLRPSRSTQCAQCSRPRCPALFPTSGRPAGSRTTTDSASSPRTSSMRRSTSSSGEWTGNFVQNCLQSFPSHHAERFFGFFLGRPPTCGLLLHLAAPQGN